MKKCVGGIQNNWQYLNIKCRYLFYKCMFVFNCASITIIEKRFRVFVFCDGSSLEDH